MILAGSRARGTEDTFSDWDYLIENSGDLATLDDLLQNMCVWRGYVLGPIRIVTALDEAGILQDYAGPADIFGNHWSNFEQSDAQCQFSDYWIFTFKHLKAIFRGMDTLADIGIEKTTLLARDIYLRERFGVLEYQDFFSFGKNCAHLDLDEPSSITGLAYRNN